MKHSLSIFHNHSMLCRIRSDFPANCGSSAPMEPRNIKTSRDKKPPPPQISASTPFAMSDCGPAPYFSPSSCWGMTLLVACAAATGALVRGPPPPARYSSLSYLERDREIFQQRRREKCWGLGECLKQEKQCARGKLRRRGSRPERTSTKGW